MAKTAGGTPVCLCLWSGEHWRRRFQLAGFAPRQRRLHGAVSGRDRRALPE